MQARELPQLQWQWREQRHECHDGGVVYVARGHMHCETRARLATSLNPPAGLSDAVAVASLLQHIRFSHCSSLCFVSPTSPDRYITPHFTLLAIPAYNT